MLKKNNRIETNTEINLIDLDKCPQCNYDTYVKIVSQERSNDEETSYRLECVNCNYRVKDV